MSPGTMTELIKMWFGGMPEGTMYSMVAQIPQQKGRDTVEGSLVH